MSSPFAGISIASTALRSFQTAMNVVGNNLANVNTDGYSRQTVSFETLDGNTIYDHGIKQVGQGVSIGAITRVRDQYLEQSRNSNASDQGKSSALNTGLSSIDSIYGEPGKTGISTALDTFFNSMSGLAADPSNSANLSTARTAGQALADNIRNKYTSINDLATETTKSINDTLAQVQTLTNQISDLNKGIAATNAGQGANALLDKRDAAVNQLASLIDIKTNVNSNNIVTVTAGGYTLVDTSGATKVPTQFNATNSSLSNGPGTASLPVSSGKLAGLFGVLNQTSVEKGQLDNLANNLRTEVNSVHAAGTNANGTTGINFFNDVTSGPQTGAGDFNLSAQVQADYKNIAAGTTGKAGDGGVAQSIADIRTKDVTNLGSKSFGDYFQANISALGSEANYQKNLNDTNASVGTQINGQIESNSGVSTDEELTKMMQLQRAYSANAKMLTVFDDVMQTTLDMVRP